MTIFEGAISMDGSGAGAGPEAARIEAAGFDRIFLHDHVAEFEIGAYSDEYGVDQHLRFNVDLDVRRFAIGDADEVDSIVSYDVIIDAIAALAAGPRMKLLETFAERLAARLLADRRVFRAIIRIEKLDRVAGSLGIEIERRAGA